MKTLSASILLFALVLSGCGGTSGSATTPATPTAPTPPQVQIANDVNALAQALDTAITALRSARDQGKLSAGDVLTAEKVAGAIAVTGKAINAELRTPDDWPTQKGKIAGILKIASLQNATANLPPVAAATLVTAVTVYNSIASSVGGPTI